MTNSNGRGRSLPSASVSLLCVNVVVNIYNLAIIWLNDNSDTQLLLGYASEVKKYFILIQTILCIIYLSSLQNISSFSPIKLFVYGSTFAMLCIDMALTFEIAIELAAYHNLDKFWQQRNTSITLENLHLIVGQILAMYFVFKGVVAFSILRFGKELRYDLAYGEYLINVENTETAERNIHREPRCLLPPSSFYRQYIADYISTLPGSTSNTPPPPPPPPPPPYSAL